MDSPEKAPAPFIRPALGYACLALLVAAPACRPRPRPPDASLHIHNLSTGEKVTALRGHEYATTAIALTADGRLALTSGGAKELCLWSIESLQKLAVVLPFQDPAYAAEPWVLGPIVHLQFLEGTNLLLVAHEKAGASLWELDRQRLVARFKPRFLWTGSAVVTEEPRRVIAVATPEPTAAVWNLAHGQPCGTFTELWKAGSRWATLAQDGEPRSWWNLDTGEPWQGTAAAPEGAIEPARHQAMVSPDGRTFLTYYGGVENQTNIHRLHVWDLETGRLRWTRHRVTLPITGAWGSSRCSALAFSPDSARLAVGTVGDRIEIHQVADGRLTLERQAPPGACALISFVPDGRSLLTYGGSTMRLWDIDQGTLKRAFNVPMLYSFTVTPDGRLLLVGGAGNNQGK